MDRLVQASVKLVLEPIFEADFKPVSYGFRPRRRAQDAIAEIHHFGTQGYHWVLEADIEACFDEISHPELVCRIRGRIGDKRVLALVKSFLKAGIMAEGGQFRDSVTGTPQGGILSPLLANIALSALDEHFCARYDAHGTAWRRAAHRRRGGATYRIVRYADLSGRPDKSAYVDSRIMPPALCRRWSWMRAALTGDIIRGLVRGS